MAMFSCRQLLVIYYNYYFVFFPVTFLFQLLVVVPPPTVIAMAFEDDTRGEIRNVLDFGAVGDGITDDTMALRRALYREEEEEMTTRKKEKRMLVWLPMNYIFLSQPLNISSYTTLRIDGTLRSLNDESTWPKLEPLVNYNTSEDGGHYLQYQSLLYALNAREILITGRGEVDGNGDWWWESFQNRDSGLLHAGRPNVVQTVNCTGVIISHLTFRDAPFWCLHPVLSVDVYIHHVTIRARTYAPNSDGIDPDSCKDVLIEHNDVGCGDDHIAIKAGRCGDRNDHLSCATDERFRDGIFVTDNVTIRHNIFRNGMGIAVGSESSGSIRNIHIHNNTVGVCNAGHDCVKENHRRHFSDSNKHYYSTGIDKIFTSNFHTNTAPKNTIIPDDSCCGWGPGLHIKTTVSRGGVIENVSFVDNTVYNTSLFLYLEAHYQNGGRDSLPEGYHPTRLNNVTFLRNRAMGAAFSATFDCPTVSPCQNITVENNTILTTNDNRNPWSCRNVETYTFRNNYPPGLEDCTQNSSTISQSFVSSSNTLEA